MTSARTIYKLLVDEIIDHTHNVRELVLKTTEDQVFKFRAGQFAMLHVPQAEGKPALRAYSIASDERQTNGFRLLFKHVPNGVASTFVWNLKGKEILNFTGPFGKVFFQEPPTEQIAFISTGTGLSQHISYLKSKKDQYPSLKYRLLFGVRSEKDIYYLDHLEELKKDLPNFSYEVFLSQPEPNSNYRKGYVGQFISELEYNHIPTTFYMCGNGAMIKEIKHQLLEVDHLDKNLVWSEAFD